jgi:predicted DNA-binding ribbon-helix-helix protein
MRNERGRIRSADSARQSAIVKRSLTISGHRTSISLEDAYWLRMKALAERRETSLSALVAEIDAARGDANLSSAIRVFVLESTP